jgi:hypothetical protein
MRNLTAREWDQARRINGFPYRTNPPVSSLTRST